VEIEQLNKEVEFELLKRALIEKDSEIARLKHYEAKAKSLSTLILKLREAKETMYTVESIVEGF